MTTILNIFAVTAALTGLFLFVGKSLGARNGMFGTLSPVRVRTRRLDNRRHRG